MKKPKREIKIIVEETGRADVKRLRIDGEAVYSFHCKGVTGSGIEQAFKRAFLEGYGEGFNDGFTEAY